MESAKTAMNKPLNRIDLRGVLNEMETDYEKIKINVANYEKDYDTTINNISADDLEKNHSNNFRNINELKYILDNLTTILNDMKSRIDKIRNFYPDEKFENLDNKKLMNSINNVFNRAKEEFNILNNKITEKLVKDKNKILSNVGEGYTKDFYKTFDDANQDLMRGRKMQEKMEKEKPQVKSGFGLNTMYNETLKEREMEFKAIYDLTQTMNSISKTFTTTVASQRIKTDFIEDEIRNSAVNVKNANEQLTQMNEKTENYKGIYYWLCMFSFFAFLIIVAIFYYKYLYVPSEVTPAA